MYDLIVIGASLGGTKAIGVVLAVLPEDFPVPVACVIHRAVDRTVGLCKYWQRRTALCVEEPDDKDLILPGHVYLAPANYHLLIEQDAYARPLGAFALSTDSPVMRARPSIDVLFESAADAYRERIVGVVLTGASEDGAQGAARIKRRCGLLIAEHPRTAFSPVMPKAAIAKTTVDKVLPIEAIGPFLMKLCRRKK
jgi:two-component system, chemotaxis family, protein-glutamate methylesterase/glutaminase